MAGKYEKKTQSAEGKTSAGKAFSFAWRCLLAAALAAVLLLNLFTHVVQVVSYNGTGMEPTIHGGQTLVLLKTQKVSDGDIIAFYYNNQVLVRRVVCSGGNQLEVAKDGTVSINGTVLPESYVKHKSKGQCNITFPYFVRTGTVFVMGDNRETAMDSRLEEIGTVPVDRIIGKVLLIF